MLMSNEDVHTKLLNDGQREQHLQSKPNIEHDKDDDNMSDRDPSSTTTSDRSQRRQRRYRRREQRRQLRQKQQNYSQRQESNHGTLARMVEESFHDSLHINIIDDPEQALDVCIL